MHSKFRTAQFYWIVLDHLTSFISNNWLQGKVSWSSLIYPCHFSLVSLAQSECIHFVYLVALPQLCLLTMWHKRWSHFSFSSTSSPSQVSQHHHKWFTIDLIQPLRIVQSFCFTFLLNFFFFFFFTFLPTCQISTYNLQLSFVFNIWMQLWMSISGKDFLFSCWFSGSLMQFFIPCNSICDKFLRFPRNTKI